MFYSKGKTETHVPHSADMLHDFLTMIFLLRTRSGGAGEVGGVSGGWVKPICPPEMEIQDQMSITTPLGRGHLAIPQYT